MEESYFLLSKSRIEINKLHHFSFSINSTYAIVDNNLLAWIPDSENLYLDSFDYMHKDPIDFRINCFGMKKIIKIFSNNQVIHSITDEGVVFSWGNDRNKTGILGLGYTYNQSSPLLNTNFANKKIKEISMSEKHAAAIDINHQIFTWGTGEYGELGKDGSKFSNIPTPIHLEKHSLAKKIQCGSTFTAFIDFNCNIVYFGKIFNSASKNKNLMTINFRNNLKEYSSNNNDDDDNIITSAENLKSNAKLINLNGIVSNIFSGASLLAIIDKYGGLYLYNDEDSLFKVKLDKKINSIKFAGSNFYALSNDTNFLYGFVNKSATHSVKNYVETCYNIEKDFSKISIIEQPYYTDLIFFYVECSKVSKEQTEIGRKKIFSIFKNHNISFINNPSSSNFGNYSSLLTNNSNINSRKVSNSNLVNGSLFTPNEKGFTSDEDASNFNSSRYLTNYKNSNSYKQLINTEKSEMSNLEYSSMNESKLKNNEDFNNTSTTSVYPINRSLRKNSTQNLDVTGKTYGRNSSHDNEQSRTSSVSNSRIDRIKNLFGYIFNKQINHINSQISYTEKQSPTTSSKKIIELERVRRNALSPEGDFRKNYDHISFFKDIKPDPKRQNSVKSYFNKDEENADNEMQGVRKANMVKKESKNTNDDFLNNLQTQKPINNSINDKDSNSLMSSHENKLIKVSKKLDFYNSNNNPNKISNKSLNSNDLKLNSKESVKFDRKENLLLHEQYSSRSDFVNSSEFSESEEGNKSNELNKSNSQKNSNKILKLEICRIDDLPSIIKTKDLKCNTYISEKNANLEVYTKVNQINLFIMSKKIVNDSNNIGDIKKIFDDQDINLNNSNLSSHSSVSKSEENTTKNNLNLCNISNGNGNSNSEEIRNPYNHHLNFVINNQDKNYNKNERYQENEKSDDISPRLSEIANVKNLNISDKDNKLIFNTDLSPLSSERETSEKCVYKKNKPNNFVNDTIDNDLNDEISSSASVFLDEKNTNETLKDEPSNIKNNLIAANSKIYIKKSSKVVPILKSINKIEEVNGRGASADFDKNNYSSPETEKQIKNELILNKKEIKNNLISNFNKRSKNSTSYTNNTNSVLNINKINNSNSIMDKSDITLKIIETVEIKNGSKSIINRNGDINTKEETNINAFDSVSQSEAMSGVNSFNASFKDNSLSCNGTNTVNKSPLLYSSKDLVYVRKIQEKKISSLTKNSNLFFNINKNNGITQKTVFNSKDAYASQKNLCKIENLIDKIDKTDYEGTNNKILNEECLNKFESEQGNLYLETKIENLNKADVIKNSEVEDNFDIIKDNTNINTKEEIIIAVEEDINVKKAQDIDTHATKLSVDELGINKITIIDNNKIFIENEENFITKEDEILLTNEEIIIINLQNEGIMEQINLNKNIEINKEVNHPLIERDVVNNEDLNSKEISDKLEIKNKNKNEGNDFNLIEGNHNLIVKIDDVIVIENSKAENLNIIKNYDNESNTEVKEMEFLKIELDSNEEKNFLCKSEEVNDVKKEEESNLEVPRSVIINNPIKTEKKENLKSGKSWNHFKKKNNKSHKQKNEAKNERTGHNTNNKLNLNHQGSVGKEMHVNNQSNIVIQNQSIPIITPQSISKNNSLNLSNSLNQEPNGVQLNQMFYSNESLNMEYKLDEITFEKINNNFNKDLQSQFIKSSEIKSSNKHKRNLSSDIKYYNSRYNLPKEIISDIEIVNSQKLKHSNKNATSVITIFSPPYSNKSNNSVSITPIASEDPIKISYDFSTTSKTDKFAEDRPNSDHHSLVNSTNQVNIFKYEDLQTIKDEKLLKNIKKQLIKDVEFKVIDNQISEDDDDLIFYYIEEDDELTDIAEVDELNESEPNSYRIIKNEINMTDKTRKVKIGRKKGIVQQVKELTRTNENMNANLQNLEIQPPTIIPTKLNNMKTNKNKKNIFSSLIKNTKPSTPIEKENSLDMIEINNNKIDPINPIPINNNNHNYNNHNNHIDNNNSITSTITNLITNNNITNSNNKTVIPNTTVTVNKEIVTYETVNSPETYSTLLQTSLTKQYRCINLDNIIEEEDETFTTLSKNLTPKILYKNSSSKIDLKILESPMIHYMDSPSPKSENNQISNSNSISNLNNNHAASGLERSNNKERIKILNERLQSLKKAKCVNLENTAKNADEISEELRYLTLQNDLEKICKNSDKSDVFNKVNKIEIIDRNDYKYNPIPTDFSEDLANANNEFNYFNFNNNSDFNNSKSIKVEENPGDEEFRIERKNSNFSEIKKYIKIVDEITYSEQKEKIQDSSENKTKNFIIITPCDFEGSNQITQNNKTIHQSNQTQSNLYKSEELNKTQNKDLLFYTSSNVSPAKNMKNNLNIISTVKKENKDESTSPGKKASNCNINDKKQSFSQSTKSFNSLNSKREQSSNRNKTNSSGNNSNTNSINFSNTNTPINNSNLRPGTALGPTAQQSQYSQQSTSSQKSQPVQQHNKISITKILSNKHNIQINMSNDKLRTPNYRKLNENSENENYSSNIAQTAPTDRVFTKSNTHKNFNNQEKFASAPASLNIIKLVKNEKKNMINANANSSTTINQTPIQTPNQEINQISLKKNSFLSNPNLNNNKSTQKKILNVVKKNLAMNSGLTRNTTYHPDLIPDNVALKYFTQGIESDNSNNYLNTKLINQSYKTEDISPIKKNIVKSSSKPRHNKATSGNSGNCNSSTPTATITSDKSNSNKKIKSTYPIFSYRNKQPTYIDLDYSKPECNSANLTNRKQIDIHSSKYPSNIKSGTNNSSINTNKNEKTLRKDLEHSIKNLSEAFSNYVNFKSTDAKNTIADILMSKLGGLDIKNLLRDNEKEPQMIRIDSKESSFSLDDDTSVFNEDGLPLDSDNEDTDPDEMRKFIYKNLENFKLKKVQEKLEYYLKNVLKTGNISPSLGLCLTPVKDDIEDESIKDRPSEYEPMELIDTSQITLTQSQTSQRNISHTNNESNSCSNISHHNKMDKFVNGPSSSLFKIHSEKELDNNNHNKNVKNFNLQNKVISKVSIYPNATKNRDSQSLNINGIDQNSKQVNNKKLHFK